MSNFVPSNEARSPHRKKPKLLSKARKTYFFQPQNNLAFSPHNAQKDVTPTKSVTNPPHSKEVPNGDDNSQQFSKTVSFAASLSSLQDMKPKEIEDLKRCVLPNRSMEQQSSDDNFDGVRWRSDHNMSKLSKPILSSPLRRSEPCNATESIVNEMTDSMLTKYGVGIGNSLSQTPHLSRAKSEIPKSNMDLSPSLNRSKSFDSKSLQTNIPTASPAGSPANSLTGLNKWMDQFDVNTAEEDSLKFALIEKDKSTPDNLKKNGIYACPADSMDNLSSDDDSFLANLRVDSMTSNVPTKVSQNDPSLPKIGCNASLAPRSDTFSDDIDPFSDDLDISALNTFATQPTASSSNLDPQTKSNQIEVMDECDNLEVGPELSFSRPDFARYKIKSIFRSFYHYQKFKRDQLILSVVDSNQIDSKLIVRGEACELELQENDIIHVIHTTPGNHKLVDDSHNLLIWNPDILVSSTTVADQMFCPRKTVLSRRFAFPGALSVPLLVGTIVHEIFQMCMLSEKFSLDFMEELLEVELERRLIEVYSVGDVIDDIKTKTRMHFGYLRKWFILYYKQKPSDIPTNIRLQKVRFSVAEILDVEESVWSPMFGIKGIADVTLKATLEGETGIGQYLLPMEIKTGRPQISHQAQAALYSLLFKDRYNIDISSFLLVYSLEEGSTTKHNISVSDLRSLINLRNRISVYLKPGYQDLPDILRKQECERCQVLQSCMAINFMQENGSSESSGLENGLYDELTEQLNGQTEYQEFFKYWDNLISKEEEFLSRANKELWVMTAKDRERKSGKALGGLVIVKCLDDNKDVGNYLYIFERSSSNSSNPLNAAQLAKYDRVIISDEAGHFALAQGYVFYVDATSITISTRRRIVPTRQKTDVFHRAKVLQPTQISQRISESIVFRIDKDEIFYGMGVARYNLLNLFLSDGDFKRRELIVDLRSPKFTSSPRFLICSDSEDFNDDQLSAFRQVSCTEDYCLILGMPGTGKTTVISHLIKMLVDAKKSVLLTSYTNSAVDNILLKVAKLGVNFIRVGNMSRIHPEIRDYVIGSEKRKINSFQDFEHEFMKPLVVASTCLSIKDLTFNVRDRFDYCIVDEASQVSMPLSLGPLAMCDKFILVGDHFQLPPLVTHPSKEVRHGLSRSLFQLLADSHPQSVVELKHQYRMCEDIMAISNKLVYEDKLVCGSPAVANQKLNVPNKKAYLTIFGKNYDGRWLDHALDENNHVIFFDHDSIPAFETITGENIVNVTEVELIKQMVEALCASGVAPSAIGVMTLYRSQLKLLLDTFKNIPELEILTADRFQGRDKECIIISMVRSNSEGKVGELMKDWRRINVAVTRARSKLIVFGSGCTLSKAESARDFVHLSSSRGWTYKLNKITFQVQGEAKSSKSSKPKPLATGITSRALQKHSLLSNILDDINN